MTSTHTPTDTVQDRINAYWSGRAPEYDAYQQRPERLELDRAAWAEVWAEALPPAPAEVLDVGTGSGYVALLLASLGHRVTGTDLSEGMLAIAREHAAAQSSGPRFRPGDAVAPDFPEASFDAVTNRYLMWTLREPQTALAAWRRLLRPGGVLALVDTAWFPYGMEVPENDDFGHWYDAEVRGALPLSDARSITETAELVTAAGFADVTVTPLTSILELDRSHGVAPGHDVRLQYLVRGVARTGA